MGEGRAGIGQNGGRNEAPKKLFKIPVLGLERFLKFRILCPSLQEFSMEVAKSDQRLAESRQRLVAQIWPFFKIEIQLRLTTTEQTVKSSIPQKSSSWHRFVLTSQIIANQSGQTALNLRAIVGRDSGGMIFDNLVVKSRWHLNV